MGLHPRQRRLRRARDRDRQVRRQADLPRDRRVQARPRDEAGRTAPRASASRSPTSARRPAGSSRPSWFKRRGLDPKQLFNYSDGATHAAERDRCRQRPGRLRDRLRPQPQRDDRGRQARRRTRPEVVWTSEPLPNDAIAVPQRLRPGAGRPHPEAPRRHHRGAGQDHPAEPLHRLRRGHARELSNDRGRRESWSAVSRKSRWRPW